jgi:hypothetical protein
MVDHILIIIDSDCYIISGKIRFSCAMSTCIVCNKIVCFCFCEVHVPLYCPVYNQILYVFQEAQLCHTDFMHFNVDHYLMGF